MVWTFSCTPGYAIMDHKHDVTQLSTRLDYRQLYHELIAYKLIRCMYKTHAYGLGFKFAASSINVDVSPEANVSEPSGFEEGQSKWSDG